MKTNDEPCAFMAKCLQALQEVLNVRKCVQDIGQNDDIKCPGIVERFLADLTEINFVDL